MKLTLAIAIALSFVSLAFAGECYSKCRFRFCDGTTKFNPKAIAPDTPFNARLCDKYGKIHLGTVDESGEALILSKYYGKPAVRISKYYPKGLKQNFSPSFFKTFSVKGYYYTNKHGKVVYNPFLNHGRHYTPHKYSSVGRETSQQGQIEFLDNKCVILPFKKYQVLDKYGHNVIDNVNTNRVFRDCVAFKVDFGKKVKKEHKKEDKKEEKKYEKKHPEMKVEKKKHVKCEYK